MDGLLLVDKPVGPTSFDVVRDVRRVASQRKVGHTGTLDPLASGLLVVCLGQGTKLVPFLMDSEKRYLAEVALGVGTDTDDAGGAEIATEPVPALDRAEVLSALARFVGDVEQIPPVYAAIKQDGVPLYRRARRGEEVAPAPRLVHIDSIELLDLVPSRIALAISCRKGTYIRALARDLARALGTVGHLAALRRLVTAGFQVDEAVPLAEITAAAGRDALLERVIPLARAVRSLPSIEVDAAAAAALSAGRRLPAPRAGDGAEPLAGPCAVMGADGELVAVASLEQGALRPVRVFAR